ncbi:MAG: hypothetical protein M3452_03910 [Chloroflexota bacterium]|nr:hypothetical protein [Chloroflexota bacterium]
MTRPGGSANRALLGLLPRALFLATATVLTVMSPVAHQAAPVLAASPEAQPASGIVMTAEPMLDGNARPGAWSAVRVSVENDGPAVDGELRISSAEQGSSSYGIAVQLASGARQDHILYGQPGFFGARFVVTLVSGGSILGRQEAPVTTSEVGSSSVFVIAERPEELVRDIRAAVTSPNQARPVVVAITPEDLPPRVEAWAAMDRLVWQDIDSTRLGSEQLEALRTWIALGGQLVIVGGSTGATTMGAFPAELLPYQPSRSVDVPLSDLAELLGTLPAGATPLPAVAGTLERGTTLGRSGDQVIAARTAIGQGSVGLIGIDPSTPWLAGSPLADALWGRALPATGGLHLNPLVTQDDGFLVGTLNNLPSVQLPRVDQLFLLLFGYIALIGPANYLILKRLDRREWAWLTMPAMVLVFAFVAYGLGVSLKGTEVIVNELAVVRGSAGTDRGVGQVYVGVFSPNRATFDVKVGGSALISNPVSLQQDRGEQPIDVLFGDPASLRDYQVGFGVLRGFRAEASVATPRIEADLSLVGDRLQGTLTNASDMSLDHVSLVFGNGVEVLSAMAPGEARSVDFDAVTADAFSQQLAERLFGQARPRDADAARTLYTRRAVIQQLSGGWDSGSKLAGGAAGEGPVVLAWRSGGALEIDVGVGADRVGETLFVLPARATASGPVVFAGDLLRHSVVAADALETYEEPNGFYLSRGTMTVDYRPVGFEGEFQVEGLALNLSQDGGRPVAGDGQALEPLPEAEQPDQDDPLDDAAGPGAEEPDPDDPLQPDDDFERAQLPHLQLFDRAAGRWVEFETMTRFTTYSVASPERYVDASGTFRVRFVNRLGEESASYFSLQARLQGTVQ